MDRAGDRVRVRVDGPAFVAAAGGGGAPREQAAVPAVPTEMIEFGWINANAMTVIDLARRRYYATVLLDHREDGSANPWGVALSPDGTWLWATLSGSHELGRPRSAPSAVDDQRRSIACLRPPWRSGPGRPTSP